MKSCSVIVTGLAAFLSGGVFAQVITPAPAQTPARDQNIPKAPAPMPIEQRVAQPQPARPQQQAPELPNDVDYEALVLKDGEGRVIALSEPLYVAALRRNPKLANEFWEKAAPVLSERRTSIEHVLVNNLDLVEKIDDGVFENTPHEPKAVQELLSTVKPLIAPAGPEALLKDLRKRGMIDELQYRVTDQIARRYTFATNPLPPKDMPKEQRGGESWRVLLQLYKVGFDEYTFYFNEMKVFGAAHMDELITKIGLDGATMGKAKLFAEELRSTTDGARRNQIFKEMRDALTLDQRKALFKEIAATMQAQRGG